MTATLSGVFAGGQPTAAAACGARSPGFATISRTAPTGTASRSTFVTAPAKLRALSTKAGDLELRIPKLRSGSFFPSLLEPRRRIDH